MSELSVTKSFISEEVLARQIEAAYGLTGVRCRLITATMRDVYLVTTNRHRYIFFVYRHGQRTVAEIAAEWQFVAYLAANGVLVAPALHTKDGDWMLALPAPEGLRHGVLTMYAAGKQLRQRPSVAAVSTYGRTVATIHALADAMPYTLHRPANDIDVLLQRFISAIELEVLERPDAVAYLQACATELRSTAVCLPKREPFYGMIHGDIIRANALVADDGSVTVLDFDLCGPGWRAYDIASYLLTIRGSREEPQFEQAFLDGYNAVRSLTELEHEMLPLFEAVRACVEIGVSAMNTYHWGSAYLYSFLDVSLERLKRSMHALSGQAPPSDQM